MHEKLEKFINKKQTQEAQKIAEQKNNLLIDLGLYEKIYSPDNKQNPEYPEEEYDRNGKLVRYKIKPIDITNDEYELLKDTIKIEENQNNIVATILTVIGFLTFIVGFFSGIAFGNIEYEFNFSITFIIWCSSFISGIYFLSISEVIKLLTTIKNKIK